MATVYAIKCRLTDITALRGGLSENGSVMVVQPTEVAVANPKPDLIFLGWGAGMEDPRDTEDDRRLRNATVTAMLLTKLRKSLSFRDAPIVVVADLRDFEDAQVSVRYGAATVVSSPFDPREISSIVQKNLKPAGQEARIDAALVNPFVEATLEALWAMASMKVKRSEILLKKDYRLFGEASAILGIMGQDLDGTVGLTFNEDLAREVVAAMWRKDTRKITKEDVNDGLGELANVISGRATTILSENTDLNFTLSIPTVVTGYGHEVSHPPDIPCLVIVFEANEKPFALQIALNTSRNRNPVE